MSPLNTTASSTLSIIALLIVVALGVFLHDAQIDSALILKIANSEAVIEYRDGPISLAAAEQHSQSDSNIISMGNDNLNPNQAIAQPLNRDNRKYISKKHVIDNDTNGDSNLPLT